MKIKDKHLRVVILIALILLIVYVSMNYQTMLEGDCSLENTTEFSAVIDDVQQKTVRDCALCSPANNNVLILNFSKVAKVVGTDRLSVLHNGETIYFRVQNIWIPQGAQTKNLLLIPIVSLRTETQEIMTLDEYNAAERPIVQRTMMAAWGLCVFLAATIVTCTIILIRRDKNRPRYHRAEAADENGQQNPGSGGV